jgi:hypothetical protein
VSALERLTERLRAEGGLLAERTLAAPRGERPRLGALAAAGPRARGREPDYELVVEAVREGYLLHCCESRVLDPEDDDLALLAGDRLYALGLAELAALGDLDAIAELADVISLTAQAQAAADSELAEAAWEAGAAAVGWGSSPAHAEAKERARVGDPGAARALREAARALAGNLTASG